MKIYLILKYNDKFSVIFVIPRLIRLILIAIFCENTVDFLAKIMVYIAN